MPVDIHKEPAELRGMHGDMRQDRALERLRALDTGKVLQVIRAGVHIMVAHDQLLVAIQLSSNSEIPLAEAEVAQVPDRILLANDAIPAAYKLGVVFLDRGEWTKGLRAGEGDDASVTEVGIANEENFAHNSTTLKILIIIPV